MADVLAVKKRNGMRNLIKLNLDVVLDQVARLIVFRKLPREIASSGPRLKFALRLGGKC